MNKKLLIIIFAVFFVVILAIVAFIAEFSHTPTPIEPPPISPTVTPVTSFLSPNPTEVNNTNKLLNNVENRQIQSDQDKQIRKQLIANITSDNDVVHQTSTYIIHYVQDADDFETEILSSDIENTKQDTIAWFKSQGISSLGICSLPLNFYLNHNTADQLRSEGKSVVFNRIPDGC